MFTKSFFLFRVFGFEVRLDITWLLLGLLVTLTLAQGFFPTITPGLAASTYFWMGVVGALGLLLSIVIHELSHALVSRRYGLPVHGITLFIFGGVAEMREEPQHPKTEFLMAVAGPITSLVLALVFYLVYRYTQGEVTAAVNGIAYYLAILNLILAVFNLVPAFPLDGGRMLRAVLWGWKGDLHWATRLAARLGSAFGIALVVLGVFAFVSGNIISGVWWFLIGLFLRGAAGTSYQQLLIREAIQGQQVRRFMNATPVTVAPGVTVDSLVEDYVYRYRHQMYPVVDQGRLLGCVTTQQVKALPRAEWPRRSAGEVMQGCGENNTVSPDTDALEAWARMSRSGSNRLMVVENDRLVGILALRDLMQYLSLKSELDQSPA